MKELIGSRHFYINTFRVVLPILLQNVITNFVSLLDNIMVGQVGTEPMSGVAIVNQLMFVYYLGVFGLLAGIGIYTAQYYGKGDEQGIRTTFLIKLIALAVYIIIAFVVFLCFGDGLINSYLHESGSGLDAAATFAYAKEYLNIMLIGLIPYSVAQVYSSTLRETQEPKLPMYAGIAAVFINLFFNYVLIYGHFGAPALGVVGAAAATNISRFAELGINVAAAYLIKSKARFFKISLGICITGTFVKRVFFTSLPLFMNEFLWSAGMTFQNQIMSRRGLEVVPAINISSVVTTLFSTFYLAMGISIGIIVGGILGRGDRDEAVRTQKKMMFASLCITTVIAIIAFVTAPAISGIYNTSDDVKALATVFIRISAIYLPMEAVVSAAYFTIRCGGRTLITFLFDSFYTWAVNIPIALFVVECTGLGIIPVYAIIFGANVVKLIVGLILVHKQIWVQTLV